MKKKTLNLFYFLTASFAFVILNVAEVSAQVSQSEMSLQQTLDYAKTNSPVLKNSKLDFEKSESQIKEVLSVSLPQISGGFQLTDNIKLPAQFVPAKFFSPNAPPDAYSKLVFGLPYTAQATLSASQLIFDGSYIVSAKATKEFRNLMNTMTAKSEMDVLNNVTKAYYMCLTLGENIKLIDANLTRVQKLLSDMTEMNKNGFVETLDVDRLQLSKSNLDIQKKNLNNLQDVAYKALKLQMGMDINTELKLSDNLESLYKNSFSDLTNSSFDASSRIENIMLNQTQNLNKLDKKRWEYGYMPNLVAFFSYNYTLNRNGKDLFGSNSYLPWVPSAFAGLKLGVPIFDGFQKQAKIQQSNIAIQKTQNDIFNLNNGLNLEFSNAKSKYILSMEMLEQQKKNMALAEKIYNTTTIKYKEGIGSSLEMQTAEADFKTAQINYVNAIYDLLSAQTDLKKASGSK